MATYNPSAGMPKRKDYGHVAEMVKAPSWLEQTIAKINANDCVLPESRIVGASGDPVPYLDSNALRGWLLGYMDSIGDQLPDLAQWRRIREEVGRSVAVKEPVKDTAVPVKPLEQTVSPHNHYWGVDWGNYTSGGTYQYAVGIGPDGQLYHLDSQGNRLNLCGND